MGSITMSFQEDLAAAKEAPTRYVDVQLEVNGRKYKFRFKQMDGVEYTAETHKHPPLTDAPFDRVYGYNITSLTKAVAPRSGVRLEGDTEVQMDADEWSDLFSVLDGGGMQEVANAVFSLNEFSSAKAVTAARKALNGSLRNSS